MNLPFGLYVNGHINLPNHTVEANFSPFCWTLYCKRVPEKGLSLMLCVGPFSLFIYNLAQQDEWFQQLLDKETVGLVPVEKEVEE